MRAASIMSDVEARSDPTRPPDPPAAGLRSAVGQRAIGITPAKGL